METTLAAANSDQMILGMLDRALDRGLAERERSGQLAIRITQLEEEGVTYLEAIESRDMRIRSLEDTIMAMAEEIERYQQLLEQAKGSGELPAIPEYIKEKAALLER